MPLAISVLSEIFVLFEINSHVVILNICCHNKSSSVTELIWRFNLSVLIGGYIGCAPEGLNN